jgi:(5-formylfuran-3-yl)methyl phosphate synthase
MPEETKPGLLVSVRDAAEARAALVGGAAIIDVKEPARGALGRADDETIADVVAAVRGRRPVSAALGELVEEWPRPACAGLAFVKRGLAGCAGLDWRQRLVRELDISGTTRAVIVAYADWQCAEAPPVDDVVALACQRPGSVLLIDTHCKDASNLSLGRKPNLLDWLSVEEIGAICERCRAAGVRVALAGSLDASAIEKLLPARPTWFAVRGAACDGAARLGTIQAELVAALARLCRGDRPE